MLSQEDLNKYCQVLRIDPDQIDDYSLKHISQAFQKLALTLHPDKAGDESTAAFQTLHEAYRQIREHVINTKDVGSTSNTFFDANFESFNFPYENLGSFTVKIEDLLASTWNECFTQVLGSPQVKATKKGTETDRFWKVLYKHGNEIELTIHLYMNPKNKKRQQNFSPRWYPICNLCLCIQRVT